jgi:membrane glycosyltransferase
MAEDLLQAGAGDRYDIYILSDTRDSQIAEAEAAAFLRLRAGLSDAGPRIYYRRRPQNIDRKAGNIADWVQTFGGAYDYMLVLDADSLMSADCVLRLTSAMDADPGLGLLQSAPSIVNGETRFARLQQFANRLYGPVFARGQHWWSGSEGNYWGHNAIIRVTAFAESAGLPHLSGPRPFGGHILSHDFVEAALLRRRGWAVRMAPELDGTYETTPPTLLDMAVRDRRWCQGNLQHARLFGAAGLHGISRLHLVRGAFAYVAPLLWFAQLILGAVVCAAERHAGTANQLEIVALFGLTVALLLGPKLMAYSAAMADRRLREGFGGASRLTAGFVVEVVLSTLTAPVLMIMQSAAVIQVLRGRDSGWAAQRREGAEVGLRQAWRVHRGHVALGVAGA